MSRHVTIDAESYVVTIGDRFADPGKMIRDAAPAHRYAILSDTNVAPLHAAPLQESLGASLHVMQAGEAFKTRDTWASLSDELIECGCGRDTVVIALGGGVVGDVAGFVASTFMRGVPVVQVPTSLLAMIDSSVGSKTGVDTPHGKNLIGTFHPPLAVFADVAMIATLPDEHRRSGLAEAIKHGVIADRGHFENIEANLPRLLAAEPVALQAIVQQSVSIKAEVVRDDPREQGRRRTLNFGHTLGHAIEHASNYKLLHGECVAIGMVLEARLAALIGVAVPNLAEEIAHTLRQAGLPITRPAELSASAILGLTKRDKKARGGVVEYALPSEIGKMAGEESNWSIPVNDSAVLEILG